MVIKAKNGVLDIDSIEIKDVVDIGLLQTFQDNFAIGMNIASVTVDKNGTPVTKPSSYTKFCIDFTHSTKIGDDRCAASHKKGGEEAARTGKPYIYTCHAGLIDFAAPILVQGHLIGTILGGQVLTNQPVKEKFTKTAHEIGVDGEDYFEAAQNVYMTNEKNVKAAAEVLYIVANAFSNDGYQKLMLRNISNTLSSNFMQISESMKQISSSSVNVNSNQSNLNDEIFNIKKISEEISEILNLIKSISDSTNMLGLNAAIESARAGEFGRGFGIVATEIRKLSENSKETAQKIMVLTKKIQESVDKTMNASNETISITEKQNSAIREVTDSVQEIRFLADELNNIANKN